MRNNRVLYLSQGAVIAALYTALTFISNAAGLSSGAVQLRLSEALTILPVFTPAAIPGLFIGCLISNILTGCLPWDIVGGSLATLIGAFGTFRLRSFPKLAPAPPIIANMLIIPFVLTYAYGIQGTIPYFMLTVGIGEVICCGVLGYPLMKTLKRKSRSIKWAR